MIEKKHGGPGRGQGRKPLCAGEKTVTVTVRMTERQREKLGKVGGAEWIRKQIDKENS